MAIDVEVEDEYRLHRRFDRMGRLVGDEGMARLFRSRVLPLVHSRRHIDQLLQGGTPQERLTYYERHWDTWRWRLMFRIFFSRFLMGRLGRDPEFFRYVSGNVAERLLHRTKYAVTELNPADNPYLQWILTGEHRTALPLPLREREFDAIRNNLDRIEVKCCSLEQYLRDAPREIIDKFNLSDIFEYISPEGTERILEQLADRGRPGSRLAYWNMLAPRSRPESLGNRLQPLPDLAGNLYRLDKAFFYSRFVVEEVL